MTVWPAEIPEPAYVKHIFVKASARLNSRAENGNQPTVNASDACVAFAILNARKQLAARFTAWRRLADVTEIPSAF
ncbi:hypothetical protein QFZ94_008653 [Paraburkholderia sp. JPY465]